MSGSRPPPPSQEERGRYLHCPDGSHRATDGQQVCVRGLIDVIDDAEADRFAGVPAGR